MTALNTEYPAETEAKQILAELAAVKELQVKHTDAVNAVGANVQWLVDNVQGIFQVFGFAFQIGPRLSFGFKGKKEEVDRQCGLRVQ